MAKHPANYVTGDESRLDEIERTHPKGGAEVKPTMAARIRALQDMTVPELRERYREVFGEETRSRKVAFFP